jgi:ketosteroid isomerase-like protein
VAEGSQILDELVAARRRERVEEEALDVLDVQACGADDRVLAGGGEANAPAAAVLGIVRPRDETRGLHAIDEPARPAGGQHALLRDRAHRDPVVAGSSHDQKHLERDVVDAAVLLELSAEEVREAVCGALEVPEGQHDTTTRKNIDVRVAHHFIVRGGRIVRFEQFVDTAMVRDAMAG